MYNAYLANQDETQWCGVSSLWGLKPAEDVPSPVAAVQRHYPGCYDHFRVTDGIFPNALRMTFLLPPDVKILVPKKDWHKY
jgi:hypothetical protein